MVIIVGSWYFNILERDNNMTDIKKLTLAEKTTLFLKLLFVLPDDVIRDTIKANLSDDNLKKLQVDIDNWIHN